MPIKPIGDDPTAKKAIINRCHVLFIILRENLITEMTCLQIYAPIYALIPIHVSM